MTNIARIKEKIEAYKQVSNFFDLFLDKKRKDKFDNSHLIKKNVETIFSLFNETNSSKPSGLMMGEVQSGKTDNIIGSIYKSVDLGFDLIINLAGTNNILKKQTNSRIPFNDNDFLDKVNVFSDKLSSLRNFKLNKTKPILISTLKGKDKLSDVSEWLQVQNLHDKKIIIIDDECDFGSSSGGTIGRLIKYLRERSYFFYYLGVTATPFSTISLMNTNVKLDFVYQMEISKNYTGVNYFSSKKDEYYIEKDFLKDDESCWEKAIEYSYFKFILNSVKNRLMGFNKNQLLFNFSLETNTHDKIIEYLQEVIEDSYIQHYKFKKNYQMEFEREIENISINFNVTIEKVKSLVQHLCGEIKKVMPIIVLNEAESKKSAKPNKHEIEIIIGGVMVSRGFTFENLTVETLLNGRNSKNAADTLLQRARWFGYRDPKKSISIILNKKIMNSYEECSELVRELKMFKNDYWNVNAYEQFLIKSRKNTKSIIPTSVRGK